MSGIDTVKRDKIYKNYRDALDKVQEMDNVSAKDNISFDEQRKIVEADSNYNHAKKDLDRYCSDLYDKANGVNSENPFRENIKDSHK